MIVHGLRAAAAVVLVSAGAVISGLAGSAGAGAIPTHVAIVVTYEGQTSTACAPAGGTGMDVLSARFPVVVGQIPPYAGFVFTISGHGTSRPDSTHYWAYWHRSGGAWTYSSTGAATYRPVAGTVEGWSYVDGAPTATRPASKSYPSICGALDPVTAPSSSPTLTASRAAGPTPRASTRLATSRAAEPSPAAAPSPASAPSPPTAPSRTSAANMPPAVPRTGSPVSSPRVRARHTTATHRVTTTNPEPATAKDTPALAGARPLAPRTAVPAAASVPELPRAATHSGGLPGWGTASALVVVAAIGGSAFWRLRSQRRP